MRPPAWLEYEVINPTFTAIGSGLERAKTGICLLACFCVGLAVWVIFALVGLSQLVLSCVNCSLYLFEYLIAREESSRDLGAGSSKQGSLRSSNPYRMIET